jgi:excisionase family DNA binding protein
MVVDDHEFRGLFIDPAVLESMAREPDGPPHAELGGQLVFRRGDLRQWVDQQFNAPTTNSNSRERRSDGGLLTREQAARYLSISVRAFDRLRAHIPAIIVGARSIRFEKSALDRYMASRQNKPVELPPIRRSPLSLKTNRARNIDWLHSKLDALKRRRPEG